MKRLNKTTGTHYKFGDAPTDEDLPQKFGKVFGTYRITKLRKNGFFAEEWTTKEKILRRKKKQQSRFQRKGDREINPNTGQFWVRGELDAKRGYFWEYNRNVRDDGVQKAQFLADFETYHRERIKTIFRKRRIFASKNKIPFNLTWQYMAEIFPTDYKCPILDIDLKWTIVRNGYNNPSFDRKEPSLGYIKGNVYWISFRANQIKSDATRSELQRVIKYL